MPKPRLLATLALVAVASLLPATAHATTYGGFSSGSASGNVDGGDDGALDITGLAGTRDAKTIRFVVTFAGFSGVPKYTRYQAYFFSEVAGGDATKGNLLEIRRGSDGTKTTLYVARQTNSAGRADTVIKEQACAGIAVKAVPAKSRLVFTLPAACLRSPNPDRANVGALAARWGSKKWRGGSYVSDPMLTGRSRLDQANAGWQWSGEDRPGRTPSFLTLP